MRCSFRTAIRNDDLVREDVSSGLIGKIHGEGKCIALTGKFLRRHAMIYVVFRREAHIHRTVLGGEAVEPGISGDIP